MRIDISLALVALSASIPANSQSMVLGSGTVTIHAGTSMRIDGPVIWSLAPGATVTNDGVVDLGTEGRLAEVLGYPFTGIGTEVATLTGPGPFAGIEPGGLGLTISSDVPGPVVVRRGHEPFTLPEGDQSIARWYEIQTDPAPGSVMAVSLRYDPVELNGLPVGSLGLFESASTSGPWTAIASSNDPGQSTVTGNDQYPWTLITVFDENAPTLSPSLVAMNGFDVWPTIVTDILNIVSRSQQPIGTVEIFDAEGRSVANGGRAQTSDHRRLDLAGLSSGAYFLRVNGNQVFKFRKA